jgi:hypothetical protein
MAFTLSLLFTACGGIPHCPLTTAYCLFRIFEVDEIVINEQQYRKKRKA